MIMHGLSIEITRTTAYPSVSTRSDDALWGGVPPGIKNPLWTGFPVRLYRARESCGIDGTNLARDAGLSTSTVRNLEDRVAIPALDTVERIAAALGLNAGWLAFGPYGYEPFRDRQAQPALPPDDPEPTESRRVFRARHTGCAQRVRLAREGSGLSMRALSAAARVSVQTWSNTEAGKTVPKVDSLERMAVALGVAPAWLAYGYEEAD